MKIRFKVGQRADFSNTDRTKYSSVAMLQIAVKYDGFHGSAEATQTIAERVFEDHDERGRYMDTHHQDEMIAEWAAKTIADLLRPLVAAEDRPKDD